MVQWIGLQIYCAYTVKSFERILFMNTPGFLDFIVSNISHVAPIIVAGLVAFAISIERYWSLYVTYPIKNEEFFYDRVREFVLQNKINEATAYCSQFSNKPVANILRKGLERFHLPESLIVNGVEIAIEQEVARVNRRSIFLGMIANVSTLLGLVGTILGLVTSFSAAGNQNLAERSAQLALGISTAMNATILGLGVAIPCMILFALFMNKTSQLTSSIEISGSRTLDIFKNKHFLEAKNAGLTTIKGA
jgi:biopolymer transport protein ExbB